MEDLQLPKGAYARIRFDGAVSGFLSTLADQLQTNAEGVFFSQLDPHAGLGCCPFHMKLISPSEMGGLRYLTVLNLLKDIGLKFEGIQGQVLPVCIVNRSGLVSLKISCSDFLPISKHIADVLPGAIDWSMKQENELTVTIGIFMGTHISAFESWLNGELSSNSSVFPVFFCDTIELSEECHPVVNEQIKLAGKLRQRNVQSSNQQGNSMSNITSHSNTDTSDKDKSSIEQRLLSAASTLCMKIGGTGMISINTPRSNQSNEPTSFSIIPTEPAKWHENCSKIFAMLDAMLRSVGSKVIICFGNKPYYQVTLFYELQLCFK